MAKLSAAARVIAEDLAVKYHAYLSAVDKQDWTGVRVWGEMLLAIQDKAGLNLCDPERVRSMITVAERERAKLMAEIRSEG